MANELRELQLQGDSTVYKLNDARITTTAVDTATHILTTNSAVSSIAPITAANLASALGVTFNEQSTILDASSYSSLEDVPQGMYWWQATGVPSFSPSGYEYAILIVLSGPPSALDRNARVAFCFNISTQKISCNLYYAGLSAYRGWFQVN